jgi:hypothetical protein
MSLDALITATVNQLRTALSLDETTCDEAAGDDGRPPNFAGQVFYGVHEGEWSNDSDLSLDERLGVHVTITLRTALDPLDRLKLARSELRQRADAVRKTLHMSYTVLNAVNVILGNTVNGLVEPLVFVDGGKNVVRGPDWFGSDDINDGPTGLSRTLRFARALRVQTLESMQ